MPKGVYTRTAEFCRAVSEGMKRVGYRPTPEHRQKIAESVKHTLNQKSLGKVKECDKSLIEV